MEIVGLLSKYYDEPQKDEVVLLMKNYDLFESFRASTLRFYSGGSSPALPASAGSFRLLMHEYLSALFIRMNGYSREELHAPDHEALLSAMIFLITDAMHQAKLSPIAFKSIFFDVLLCISKGIKAETCMGCLITRLAELRLLQPADVTALITAKQKQRKDFSMLWMKYPGDKEGQINFHQFAQDICADFPGKKNAVIVSTWFEEKVSGKLLIVPPANFCTFLALIELLCICKRIICSHERGLILFLSRHVAAPSNKQSYGINQFSMMKLRTMANPDHKLIIKEKVRKIFTQYCPGPENRQRFEEYFK